MKVLLIIVVVLAALYVLLCGLLYWQQERLLFFPTRLPPAYQFSFREEFAERWITTSDGQRLHGLLFTVPKPKGLIFYLHGNGGALDSWGEAAVTYTALGYDVFMLDYRGYGKSGGRINSEQQLFTDVETAYQTLLAHYDERQTVILGYSLGTGPATWLAARHQPRRLILQAPYYSMQDLSARLYPFVPGFLLRYPLRTNEVIGQVTAPVVLFHGREDEVIYYSSSVKLQHLLGPNGQLITLPGAGHNGMTDNPLYRRKLTELL
jgi:alpha-beta hydrolase superfamily lysophospholipase